MAEGSLLYLVRRWRHAGSGEKLALNILDSVPLVLGCGIRLAPPVVRAPLVLGPTRGRATLPVLTLMPFSEPFSPQKVYLSSNQFQGPPGFQDLSKALDSDA